MNTPENILNTLTDEQKKKVEAAQSPEELSALAKKFGMEKCRIRGFFTARAGNSFVYPYRNTFRFGMRKAENPWIRK